MKLLERLTKRVATTASAVVTDSVKTEAKNIAVNAIPIVLSAIAIVAGVVIFAHSNDHDDDEAHGIRIDTMNVTTNYILDSSAKEALIDKLMNM